MVYNQKLNDWKFNWFDFFALDFDDNALVIKAVTQIFNTLYQLDQCNESDDAKNEGKATFSIIEKNSLCLIYSTYW